MPTSKDLELFKAAYKTVKEIIRIKEGESLLITIDSISDFRVAEEMAKAGEALGAKVMVAWHTTPKGYGKACDPYLPEPLFAACPATDAWIELNNQWLLYGTPWTRAVTNGRTRNLMLGGLSTDQLIRCIGEVDIQAQIAFQEKVVEITKRAKGMKIVNAAGTNVTFENHPDRPFANEHIADTPGGHFLIGQIGWAPREETINGTIVFDGAISGGGEADIGVVSEPVIYEVEKGRIKEIRGGKEAEIVKKWFEKLDDPNMYLAAHVCYGFNPKAKLGYTTTEDERVWGCTEWGFGYQGPMYSGGKPREAASHIDGISLACSVTCDGQPITKDGEVVHPELRELAKACGH
ncbi:MAG: leucyl aminopeptidase [Deltaproteobacteria bacterium]|nr:leucyl aminopeptidase [Deltaproteobacteria bacterium]MBW1927649.1 leucyl aminopeptidase [Deltaproteobacteria bacterium]MBW2026251.1 leucyl aminopeptidase [Deltaproteobacteria bacterium]MBW2127334.1 leucyl aminopeptidase [Deltaproteobacteria bacterium]